MTNIFKLNDLSFYSDASSSKYHKPKYFKWQRMIEDVSDNEPVFFTDSCLEMANMPIYKNAKRIAWIIEPPSIRKDCYEYIYKNHALFDIVLTHQTDLIPQIPNAKYYPSHMSWVAKEDWKNYDKTKSISIVASDKNYTEGHQLRHRLIKSYNVNDRPLDVYGSCTGKFLEHKIESLAPYRFQVCIENARLNGYYTEKLVDCLTTYTIPIYWGCPNIKDYFNPEGMIICNDIEDIKTAIDLIKREPQKAYELGKPFIDENFERATKWSSPEDYIYENILQ